MKYRTLGMVWIAVSIFFLLSSFYTETMIFLGYNIPLAGISIIFVIFAVLFFQYADKHEIKAQENVSGKVSEEIEQLTTAIASDLKREDKIKTDLEKEISTIGSDLKNEDKVLASKLKTQEKMLTSSVKKQGKVNVEVKKKIKYLSSEVKKQKKQKLNTGDTKPGAKPAGKKKN